MISVRLTWVQLFDGADLKHIARSAGRSQITIKPKRGIIYDRKGRALTENLGDFISLGVNRHRLINPKRLAKDLSTITGRSYSTYMHRLSSGSSYISLARKISPDQALRIKDLGWSLIEEPDVRRVYPYRKIGSQLVGFTNVDEHGISGIEMICDSILTGKPGWRVVEVDVLGNPQIKQKLPFQPSVNGGDVILTIDIEIQSILQEELGRAMRKHRPRSATGIVIDPGSGEVLAAASLPCYDPNDPLDNPVANQKNRFVCDLYEMGSTSKIIAAAMLLEKGYANASTLVNTDPGYVEIHGKRIHDVINHGVVSFRQAVSISSNVGIIKLCEPLTSTEIFRSISDFGLLQETGIEIPGEAAGRLLPIAEWSGLTKPNVVIGQGVSTTLLSMAMAYQAIANKGVQLKPSIIYGIRHPDGDLEMRETQPGRRVVSENTAKILSEFLVEVTNNGTGKAARIKNIPGIATKSGTAQKPDIEKGGYKKNKYLSSFIGYFPVPDPCYLILIALDEPRGSYYGGEIAAPVFRKVAERIIRLSPEIQRIVKDPDHQGKTQISVPDYCFKQLDDVKQQSKKDGFNIEQFGKGSIVYDQTPPAGVLVESGATIQLTLGPEGRQTGGVVIVPMLINHSLRDAIYKATNAGLEIRVKGSGRVVKQSLKVGSRVEAGDLCEIFAREI